MYPIILKCFIWKFQIFYQTIWIILSRNVNHTIRKFRKFIQKFIHKIYLIYSKYLFYPKQWNKFYRKTHSLNLISKALNEPRKKQIFHTISAQKFQMIINKINQRHMHWNLIKNKRIIIFNSHILKITKLLNITKLSTN